MAPPLQRERAMPSRDRGFTLLELMFAVAVLGILVSIAVVAYTRNVRKVRSGEVVQIFGELKMRQDVWHAENGSYLPLCPSPSGATGADCPEGQYWPASLPGGGKAMDATDPPARWRQARVSIPSGSLYCQYSVVAGKANSSANIGEVGSILFPTAPVRNWYYLMAQCDWDGDDAINARYWQRDDWTELGRENEGR
jgi:prepilin-type N-terminal cleavage/methylation domain-containing protein